MICTLTVFATYRLTRVITRDAFPLIALPREAFVQRWAAQDEETPDGRRVSLSGERTNIVMRSLAYLWECDWCASMYVAAALGVLAHQLTPLGDQHWIVVVLLGLTSSALTGVLAQREPD